MNEYEDDVVLTDVSKISEEIKLQSKRNHSKIILCSFFSFAIVGLIATYLFSPIGKVKINNLSGNYYLNKDDVISLCGLSKHDSLLKVSVEKTIRQLNESPYVSRSSINWHLTYINVYVDEVAPIAKFEDDDIVLTNGESLKNYTQKYSSYKIDNYQINEDKLPVFIRYVEQEQTKAMTSYSKNLLNALKTMDKDLYNNYLVKLDETSILLKDQLNPEVYLGLFFKINEDTNLRIRVNQNILRRVIQNTDILKNAIRNYAQFSLDETKNIYDCVCYEKNNAIRLSAFEEVASDGQNS